jgi:hypothetical protein
MQNYRSNFIDNRLNRARVIVAAYLEEEGRRRKKAEARHQRALQLPPVLRRLLNAGYALRHPVEAIRTMRMNSWKIPVLHHHGIQDRTQ